MRIEISSIEKIANEIALTYGKSYNWKRRVIKRVIENTVIRVLPGKIWIVKGLPELGDRYPFYEIFRKGNNYICSCYTHSWSSRRRPCTHIGAVLLYERLVRPLEPGPGFEPGK